MISNVIARSLPLAKPVNFLLAFVGETFIFQQSEQVKSAISKLRVFVEHDTEHEDERYS